MDVSELRRYADLGIDLHQGSGALRAWIDLSRGQVVGGVEQAPANEPDAVEGVLARAAPERLVQVLDNLLANALDAAPRGSGVAVSVPCGT